MRGIVSAQVSSGSRTCVVVGSLDGVDQLDLARYRSLLWFAQPEARIPERFRVPEHVTHEPVDRTEPERVSNALDRLIQRDTVKLPSVYLTEEAVGPSAEKFLPIVEAILAQCESHLRARLTRQRVGFLWQSHILTNASAYARQRVPRAWKGALAGVPAFVCGSGPSLDASGAKLAAVAGQGVVLAADSALGALNRLRVPVDFAVTIDATKTPEKCLPPDAAPPARLLMSTISPPEWREAVPEEDIAFLSGNQMTENWLAGLGLPKTDLTVQGNCGITAVELAVYLGCSPIYLFGMDNAVDGKGSGRLHQQHFDTRLLGEELYSAGGNYPKVPGNYQEEIATPFLREYRLLDARCAELPPGLVVNVIDRGARLANTTLVHPDDLAVAAPATDKAARLACLAELDTLADKDWHRLAKSVRYAAGGVSQALTEAWNALHRGDLARALRFLANAFKNDAFVSMMGNYSLKVTPHLLQPSEQKFEFWESLIGECRRLAALARDVA